MTRIEPERHRAIDLREIYVHSEREPCCETRHEIGIAAAPATVHAFLTDAVRMSAWLSRDVIAEARRGGLFRLTDFNESWIEGTYLDVIQPHAVVFSWGGIEGLRPRQSVVEVTMHISGLGTLVGLRHFGLSRSAVRLHRLLWTSWGLPKLKTIAEGRDPGINSLSEIANWREQHAFS